MRLRIPNHNSDKFSYNKDTHKFFTDVSDLDGPLMGRVYDDACDVGFIMHSQRTGSNMLFLYVGDVVDDGEVTAWKFESASGQYKSVVFND
jgi:hypothetical protein